MINWLKKKWYGLGTFNDLELLILNAVRDKLSSDAIILWDKQTAEINKVSRLPHGVESIFYVINLRTGKPDFDNNIRFPNKQSSLLLACVKLKFRSDKIDIEVWCEGGHLLLLNFKGSANYWIEYLGEISEDDDERIEVDCTLLADVMKDSL